jgi:hypothetical protein
MALGSTQPLTEMSTRNISLVVKRPVRRADNLATFMCRLSSNLGASTSWNPQGLPRPVMGLLYLYLVLSDAVEITNTMHRFAPPLYSYMLAPTCFGSSLPSSGNFWTRLSYVKIQIDIVVYHIMCGYVACVTECRGSVCCASQLSADRHTGHITTHYMIYHQLDLYFK